MKTRPEIIIIIVIVVISIITSTLAITNVYDRIKCDEHGECGQVSSGMAVLWTIMNAERQEASKLAVCQIHQAFHALKDVSLDD